MNVFRFEPLSDKALKEVKALPKIFTPDQISARVLNATGGVEIVPVPRKAAALIVEALELLRDGKGVVVLAEERRVDPRAAAT